MNGIANEAELEEAFTEDVAEEPELEEAEESLEAEEEAAEKAEELALADEEEGLEYDEDGNVLIPQDDGELENKDSAEAELDGESAPEDAADVEISSAPDVKDEEIARLKQEKEDYETLLSDALTALGVKGDNGKEALIKLAAEAKEMTPEEYLKRLNEKKRADRVEAALRKTEFEKKAQLDLAEIHAAFPETKIYKSLLDIPNLEEFGEYRDKGLSAKKAYIAANPDAVRTSVAEATKRQSLNETKNHLKSNVPKGSKDTSRHMTRRELEGYRDLFPGLSDKEISELYRDVTK